MALEGAMPALQAEQTLRDKGFAAFEWNDLYDLVLLATGSTEAADKAACERKMAEMAASDGA